MDPEIITIRRDICGTCEKSCGVRATINHADPCAACPAMVWHAMGNCEQVSPAVEPPLRGLGDAVAVVAQPIAKAIDSVLGTKVRECGGCKARQAALNKAFPLK